MALADLLRQLQKCHFGFAVVDVFARLRYTDGELKKSKALISVKNHTKSKTGRRRSHLARKKVAIGVCPSCKAPRLSHRACANCGKSK